MSRQLDDCDGIDRNDGFSSNVDMNTSTPAFGAPGPPLPGATRDGLRQPLAAGLAKLPGLERHRTAERAHRLWKRMLKKIQVPPIDPGIVDGLNGYIARRREEVLGA